MVKADDASRYVKDYIIKQTDPAEIAKDLSPMSEVDSFISKIKKIKLPQAVDLKETDNPECFVQFKINRDLTASQMAYCQFYLLYKNICQGNDIYNFSICNVKDICNIVRSDDEYVNHWRSKFLIVSGGLKYDLNGVRHKDFAVHCLTKLIRRRKKSNALWYVTSKEPYPSLHENLGDWFHKYNIFEPEDTNDGEEEGITNVQDEYS